VKRPTKDELAAQLRQIEALVREHPEGISLAALLTAFEDSAGEALPERTISRRVSTLVDDGRVRVEGSARATRYHPHPAQESPSPDTSDTQPAELTGDTPYVPREGEASRPAIASQDEDIVPLSTEGKAVRSHLRRPAGMRRPVGYDEDFLRGYVPGVTWYLPEEMRRKLHDRGRTPDPHRPAGTFARDIFERLLIDLAWASSRLEGNTYSRLDTRNLLEHGVRAEGKNAADRESPG